MTDRTVLLVDDDAAFRAAYRELLGAEGYRVVEARDPIEARRQFESSAPRLVVLDLMLPPSQLPKEGEALLGAMLSARPDTKVIVVSGAGDTELALALVKRGAYDFLTKPVDPDVLSAVLARADARLVLEDRVGELEKSRAADEGLLGQSPAFMAALALADRAAPADVPVLLTGESGTGKEVFARHIHARSRRASKPFVAVNCGALSPTLLESTLFGHKKGAFTGATTDAPGLFVEADGGTLFLDEIGDVEGSLQVKFLRAIESGEILPVGASKTVRVDVRIISATHKPLAEMVAAGKFRDDLYWRIRGIDVALPRLADRTGDVVVLAQHFLNQARVLVPRSISARLSQGAIRRLEEHAWPGNLRELKHEMQRALVISAGRDEILEEDLSPALSRPSSPANEPSDNATLEQKIAALERRELERALAAEGGNRSRAAERLGLSRQGFLNKLDRYGLR